MNAIGKFAMLATATAAAMLCASAADARTVTQTCKKALATGQYSYDSSKFSEDDIITVVHFRQTSRDARFAYGVCTINLKYQPAD